MNGAQTECTLTQLSLLLAWLNALYSANSVAQYSAPTDMKY